MTAKDETVKEQAGTSAISEDETRYLEQTALLGLEYVLSDFVKQFQKSARRWEMMAYPAMVVFGLLAISGFWLIFSLTKDMNRMSDAIDPNMGPNLSEMSKNIADLDITIRVMSTHIKSMSADMKSMNASIASMKVDTKNMSTKLNAMDPLLFNMAEMNQSIKQMTFTTGVMSHDMNKISRPMRFMNNFVP